MNFQQGSSTLTNKKTAVDSPSFFVFALGGLQEVGKNCYVLETAQEIIIIDCGSKFINNESLVSASIPDFSYLEQKKEKIKGLFITHAHDDHLAGVFFLLQKIPNLTLYASAFTVSLAKQKTRIDSAQKWHIFNEETTILTADFRLNFFQVTHSIPGSFGFLINCLPLNLKLVVTGDFKFDWTQIGERFNLSKLTEFSKSGVDLLFSESTNAEIEGTTPSEARVVKRLENIIVQATKKVIITSFSSNVYRLKKIMEIATKTNRKIVLLGTSLLKAMKAIRASSLWELDNSVFLKSTEIIKTPPEKLIIFCTGSQGEERSVLTRLANKTYPGWKIENRDSVIWTSSPIMDNRVSVEFVNNKLFASGALIYENSPSDLLHASGHACQEDLKLLLTLVKPRFFFPYHGEGYMLKKHSQLAQELGLPAENIFVCQNGDVLEYREARFFLSNWKVPAGPTFILENKIIPAVELQHDFGSRAIMAQSGVLVVILLEFGAVCIYTYGFLNMQKSKSLVDSWKKSIKNYLAEQRSDGPQKEELLINYIKNFLLASWVEQKPLIKIIELLAL